MSPTNAVRVNWNGGHVPATQWTTYSRDESERTERLISLQRHFVATICSSGSCYSFSGLSWLSTLTGNWADPVADHVFSWVRIGGSSHPIVSSYCIAVKWNRDRWWLVRLVLQSKTRLGLRCQLSFTGEWICVCFLCTSVVLTYCIHVVKSKRRFIITIFYCFCYCFALQEDRYGKHDIGDYFLWFCL
jgi:hypothetical protein